MWRLVSVSVSDIHLRELTALDRSPEDKRLQLNNREKPQIKVGQPGNLLNILSCVFLVSKRDI